MSTATRTPQLFAFIVTEISYQQGLVTLDKDVFELFLGRFIHILLVVSHQGFRDGLPDCIHLGHTATGTEMSTLVNCSFPRRNLHRSVRTGASSGAALRLDEAGPLCICPAVAVVCSGRPAGTAEDPGRACTSDPPRAALTPGKLATSFLLFALNLRVCV